ncbi:hypothetical protein ACWEQL_31120 [Kitasatospora sp. NPDC004240]
MTTTPPTPTTVRRPQRRTGAALPGPRPPAPARPRTRCCRTWSSEHLSPGGTVVRTTWHEPACRTPGR